MSVKSCGKKCLNFVIGCLFMCLIALGISEIIRLYLRADVYESFIQDYFELTDGNTTELTDILIKYRDETKTLKHLRLQAYPLTNNYIDVVNEFYKKAIEDLEEFNAGLKEQEEKIEELIKFIKETTKKVNNKLTKIKEKD